MDNDKECEIWWKIENLRFNKKKWKIEDEKEWNSQREMMMMTHRWHGSMMMMKGWDGEGEPSVC